MKKLIRIIMYFCVFVCAGCFIFAIFSKPEIITTTRDRFLYAYSLSWFFLILLLGFLWEVNIFNIQQKIPFFRKRNIGTEILLWIIILLFAGVGMGVIQSAMSEEYKTLLAEKRAEEAENNKQNIENEEVSDIETSGDDKNQIETQTTVDTENEENLQDETQQIQQNVNDWSEYAKNSEDYLKTMQYLSENFRFEKYTDNIDDVLDETGATLVKALYEEYLNTGELNENFTSAFTEFFSTEEYADMFIDGGDKSEVYDMLSYSFEISWKSDGTYYIGLPTYLDDDIPEGYPDYLNAQGYAGKGSVLYTIENGEMVKAVDIIDVAYGTIIDNTAYGIAFLVQYEGESEQEWKDGENLLQWGMYYVSRYDSGRRLKKYWDDYTQYFNWKQLGAYYTVPLTDVWMGAGSCKVLQFTIESYDINSDSMVVRYINGNTEVKSYNAMVGNTNLYIME